ncbi:hypothetical protein SH1V18_44420 [Vallitalea longa]|uniref:Uncharacterized protein n=1 Tax=Vallitalea longa TaxID=2936439 RepID=A0A9W5YEC5_9FIRM|nr:hypothetical protein [Vallitalea longa]GKX31962.1 hypothetical protein SH1V18_44420 [Vallitalea longa]
MNYNDKVHRIGRITGIIVLIMIAMIPTIVCLKYNIFPPFMNLVKGIGMVCMIYIPMCAAEFVTYTPMLGTSASYLAFVTGNVTNLKIPCALMCMENVGVKPQTEEGEVIAGISVAVSAIVTVIVVFIGMLAVVPLEPVLNSPVLKPAFDNILPALFGALGAYWIQKQWKLAIVPLTFVVLAFALFNIPSGAEGVMIPIMGIISVISARIMYNKRFIKEV